MPDLQTPEAPVRQDEAPPEQAVQAPEQAAPPSPPPAPKKKVRTAAAKKKLVKRIIAIVATLAILSGIGFGMWLLVFREDDSLGDIYAEPAYIGSIQSIVQGSGNANAKETATVTIPANGTASSNSRGDAWSRPVRASLQ